MFFFFKQETAYEMRISDWSSDVCSSDLVGVAGLAPVIALRQPYHAAASHVDRRIDLEWRSRAHGVHRRKLASSRAPVAADRSGWNCAPQSRPLRTPAQNGLPCQAMAGEPKPPGEAEPCTNTARTP